MGPLLPAVIRNAGGTACVREEDKGEHRIQILFVNPDGHSLIPVEKSPNVTFNLPALPPESFFLSRISSLLGLPSAAGRYDVRVLIDGRPMSTLPLQVMQPCKRGTSPASAAIR